MKSYFIEIPLALIHEDQRYPDCDNHHIYEHLKYFCSKCFPLPAIDVSLVDEKLVVTRGHKYLRAARELGYPWLGAVYRSHMRDPQALLDELPPGTRITPRELLERESAVSVARES